MTVPLSGGERRLTCHASRRRATRTNRDTIRTRCLGARAHPGRFARSGCRPLRSMTWRTPLPDKPAKTWASEAGGGPHRERMHRLKPTGITSTRTLTPGEQGPRHCVRSARRPGPSCPTRKARTAPESRHHDPDASTRNSFPVSGADFSHARPRSFVADLGQTASPAAAATRDDGDIRKFPRHRWIPRIFPFPSTGGGTRMTTVWSDLANIPDPRTGNAQKRNSWIS